MFRNPAPVREVISTGVLGQVGSDGTWSHIWPDTELNKGDTIYYWYYLVIDKKGYQVLQTTVFIPLDSWLVPVP